MSSKKKAPVAPVAPEIQEVNMPKEDLVIMLTLIDSLGFDLLMCLKALNGEKVPGGKKKLIKNSKVAVLAASELLLDVLGKVDVEPEFDCDGECCGECCS